MPVYSIVTYAKDITRMYINWTNMLYGLIYQSSYAQTIKHIYAENTTDISMMYITAVLQISYLSSWIDDLGFIFRPFLHPASTLPPYSAHISLEPSLHTYNTSNRSTQPHICYWPVCNLNMNSQYVYPYCP